MDMEFKKCQQNKQTDTNGLRTETGYDVMDKQEEKHR